MKISVITPTFNSEKTIGRTIQSILDQNQEGLEIVLVDNVSSDNTVQIAKDMLIERSENLVTIVESDSGISEAFSKGVKSSTSEIIGILNSDDMYFNNNVILRVLEAFEDDCIDFIHGDMLFEDKAHGTNVRKPLMCSLQYGMPINHPTFFVRRRVYEEVGTFNINYRFAMDFELLCRMYETPEKCRYKGLYLNGKPLVVMHAGGVSWKHELKSIDEVEKALKEHGFWGRKAFLNQFLRRTRIRLKNILSAIGFSFIVKMWRNFKWRDT